jgi:thermitase
MSRTLRALVLAIAAALCIAVIPATASATDTVIVKYRESASSAQRAALADRLDLGRKVGQIRRLGGQVVKVDGNARHAAAQLERARRVAYAEPNKILRTQAVPNDPLFGQLWGLKNTGQTGGTADADIDAPEGWDAAGMAGFPSSGGVKVGIVDTGIQAAHPDLAGKVVDCAQSIGLIPGLLPGSIRVGGCADDNGHGTHVAGTVTANANNGAGVTGVAFNSRLSICRALSGPVGIGTTADIANCITWVHDRGARVLSMSFGGAASTTLQNAINYAWKGGAANGTVLVAAAGNDGDATLNYPAAYPNVVSVAATDHNDQRASFSNANADVEVAAPGVDVLSTWNNGGYDTISGTSMATPHAAAVAAVIRTLNSGLTAAQVVSRLDAATDDKGGAGRDTSYGFGRVNLAKAATG